jgi:DnaJ-class molecular chaperone
MNNGQSCGSCGGDGQLSNSFGNTARCPSCHGTGRRAEDTGFHDVTKTKPSHHRGANNVVAVAKQTWPTTFEGDKLAIEVKDCAHLSADTKSKLTREIIDHESTHATCTQTFVKKLRKQMKLAS